MEFLSDEGLRSADQIEARASMDLYAAAPAALGLRMSNIRRAGFVQVCSRLNYAPKRA